MIAEDGIQSMAVGSIKVCASDEADTLFLQGPVAADKASIEQKYIQLLEKRVEDLEALVKTLSTSVSPTLRLERSNASDSQPRMAVEYV